MRKTLMFCHSYKSCLGCHMGSETTSGLWLCCRSASIESKPLKPFQTESEFRHRLLEAILQSHALLLKAVTLTVQFNVLRFILKIGKSLLSCYRNFKYNNETFLDNDGLFVHHLLHSVFYIWYFWNVYILIQTLKIRSFVLEIYARRLRLTKVG